MGKKISLLAIPGSQSKDTAFCDGYLGLIRLVVVVAVIFFSAVDKGLYPGDPGIYPDEEARPALDFWLFRSTATHLVSDDPGGNNYGPWNPGETAGQSKKV